MMRLMDGNESEHSRDNELASSSSGSSPVGGAGLLPAGEFGDDNDYDDFDYNEDDDDDDDDEHDGDDLDDDGNDNGHGNNVEADNDTRSTLGDSDDTSSTSNSTMVATDEECPYDISIAASHSYLGPGLVQVSGRAVLEAGWRGRVPAAAHHGVVFPGETVPMLLPHARDAALLVQAIKNDKLFGLLCPDESGTKLSGYGVLCEVMMAGFEEAGEAPTSVTFKARAIHRFRLRRVPRDAVPIHSYSRMRFVEVEVLPEMAARDTLRTARLASLDPLRSPDHLAPVQRRLRALDAAATPWPRFVYDMFELRRLRRALRAHFAPLALAERLPDDTVSLSFWVASNLALAPADRLALFAVDSALLRLHMECHFINRKSVLSCSSCRTQIARREDIFAMSSEGVHSNYTNLGGYMHDILTVSRATGVQTSGARSAEYSWFPGYTWVVLLCANCMSHVGWRFEAEKRNLRPLEFYGLCRNYVQPLRGPERDALADAELAAGLPRDVRDPRHPSHIF
ncbi:hypothetical protein PYW07_006783 [Mythimna separata]|uniref:Protein cereblon n=1 Tax=Mythimna separata TaxID=271217 RepID=A0AAD7YU74_MYTSE|nr:hypothetical protein PYW07_006783 [Mythimna separata]